jgi:hypothetical protein
MGVADATGVGVVELWRIAASCSCSRSFSRRRASSLSRFASRCADDGASSARGGVGRGEGGEAESVAGATGSGGMGGSGSGSAGRMREWSSSRMAVTASSGFGCGSGVSAVG